MCIQTRLHATVSNIILHRGEQGHMGELWRCHSRGVGIVSLAIPRPAATPGRTDSIPRARVVYRLRVSVPGQSSYELGNLTEDHIWARQAMSLRLVCRSMHLEGCLRRAAVGSVHAIGSARIWHERLSCTWTDVARSVVEEDHLERLCFRRTFPASSRNLFIEGICIFAQPSQVSCGLGIAAREWGSSSLLTRLLWEGRRRPSPREVEALCCHMCSCRCIRVVRHSACHSPPMLAAEEVLVSLMRKPHWVALPRLRHPRRRVRPVSCELGEGSLEVTEGVEGRVAAGRSRGSEHMWSPSQRYFSRCHWQRHLPMSRTCQSSWQGAPHIIKVWL